jgi:Fe-S cluster assembly protein SufD
VRSTAFLDTLDAERARLSDGAAGWRSAALAEFAAAGVPTPRREEWRYTDLRQLAERTFELVPSLPTAAELDAARGLLSSLALPTEAARAVFIDGRFAPELSAAARPELELTNLAANRDAFTAKYRQRIGAEHPLAALNTAFADDGVLLRVPDGVVIPDPVHLVFLGSGRPHLAPQPRIVIDLGRGSSAIVCQTFADTAGANGWINSVTQVELAADARLTFLRLQQHETSQAHTALFVADVAAGGQISVGYVDHGGQLIRNDIQVRLHERGAAAEVYGLLLAGEGQHVDDHTRIDHFAPETRSDEAFRAVIGRRGHGVFNGKVVVHRDAQRIDARQTNDTLLLADHAEIDTKPELEIYADDVKCSHGSTVGELDAEQLFYLRSRGIEETEGRELLTRAFAAAVLERVHPALRERAAAQLNATVSTLLERQA